MYSACSPLVEYTFLVSSVCMCSQRDLFWIIFRKCVHSQCTWTHTIEEENDDIRGVNYNEIKEESFRLLIIFLRGVAAPSDAHDRIQNAYNGILRLLMLYDENLLSDVRKQKYFKWFGGDDCLGWDTVKGKHRAHAKKKTKMNISNLEV